MFKKTIFLLLLLGICLLPKTVSAEWSRFEDNPLTFKNNYDGWQENYKLQTFVLRDQDQFKMWYASYKDDDNQKIGLATSVDGISWTSLGPINININQPIHDPTVIKEGSGFVMWFTAESRENGDKKMSIYRAVSADGQNWTLSPNTPVIKDQEFTWKSRWVSAPFIKKENEQYKIWFAGNNGHSWAIGSAVSSDGINWSENPQNPILGNADGPFIEKENNNYYLYYQYNANSGRAEIHRLTSADGLGWKDDETLIKSINFYEGNNISPSVVNYNNNKYLYYTGLQSGQSYVNLATLIPLPVDYPVVVIPGMFGSWNKQAILHNQPAPYASWFIPSFVKEYNGLLQTLKNLGYVENKNLFVFAYDWRADIEQSARDLNNFLEEKRRLYDFRKVKLVGHSLGGLVARIYAQNHTDKVKRLITVGSPQQGVVQVYRPLLDGNLERDNTWMWLAQKIILVLNQKNFATDQETLKNLAPVLVNLLPTFDFLQKENGVWLNWQDLSLKNNVLPSYQTTFPNVYQIFTAFYGEKGGNTPAGFLVETPNSAFPNGKIKTPLYGAGDLTVLSKSATEKNDPDKEKAALDHQELISSPEGIKKILELLSIKAEENKLVSGEKTELKNALIFLVQSPVTIKISHNDKTYREEEGIVFIDNPEEGDYQLKITALDKGDYTIIIGQLSKNNEIWETISGSVGQSEINREIKQVGFVYQASSAISIFANPSPTTTLTPTPVPTGTNSNSVVYQSSGPSSATPLGYFVSQIKNLDQKVLSAQAQKKLKKMSNNLLAGSNKKSPPTRKQGIGLLFGLLIITAAAIAFFEIYKPRLNAGWETFSARIRKKFSVAVFKINYRKFLFLRKN